MIPAWYLICLLLDVGMRDKQEPYFVINYNELYWGLCSAFAWLIWFPIYLLLYFTPLYSSSISFCFSPFLPLIMVMISVWWRAVELVSLPNLLLSCPVVVIFNHWWPGSHLYLWPELNVFFCNGLWLAADRGREEKLQILLLWNRVWPSIH